MRSGNRPHDVMPSRLPRRRSWNAAVRTYRRYVSVLPPPVANHSVSTTRRSPSRLSSTMDPTLASRNPSWNGPPIGVSDER